MKPRFDIQVVDKQHPLDIGIARWLRDNRCMQDAALYLRKFGWSVDAARCILLKRGTSNRGQG